MYPVLSHRVSKFSFEGFQLVFNRVVVVPLFYQTKRTAEGLVSFAKKDQKVNR